MDPAQWPQNQPRARTLGVIGVIFESRPNVTADAGALCLKAGNAVILRTGSGALRSAIELVKAMQAGLGGESGADGAIQLVPVPDREAVGLMLSGSMARLMSSCRAAGKASSRARAGRSPACRFSPISTATIMSMCMKRPISTWPATVLLNSKLRRTGVCGAAETLLVDQACASTHLSPLVKALLDAGCAVRGDEATRCRCACHPGLEEDWNTEFLDKIIAVKVVEGLDEAIRHVEAHGSHHTDAIITADDAAPRASSRRWTAPSCCTTPRRNSRMGGEFGFGAEIGIATGRMHARGPVGVEQLTSFKYVVKGEGTVEAVKLCVISRGGEASNGNHPSFLTCPWNSRSIAFRIAGNDTRAGLTRRISLPPHPPACVSACSAVRSTRRMRGIGLWPRGVCVARA